MNDRRIQRSRAHRKVVGGEQRFGLVAISAVAVPAAASSTGATTANDAGATNTTDASGLKHRARAVACGGELLPMFAAHASRLHQATAAEPATDATNAREEEGGEEGGKRKNT